MLDILNELGELKARCIENARACPLGTTLVSRWMELRYDISQAFELAINGVVPVKTLALIHAEFRSLELEQLHTDIERQFKDSKR